MVDEFTHEPRIAYFSMEIALRNEMQTYAGGLGILAGDTVRSAADLGLPLVAVSLVSTIAFHMTWRRGFLRTRDPTASSSSSLRSSAWQARAIST
jgi:hypothetical protein